LSLVSFVRRVSRRSGRAVTAVLAVFALVLGLATLAPPANAESSVSGSSLYSKTQFFVYAEAGEFLDLNFLAQTALDGHVEVTKPDGAQALACLSSSVSTNTCVHTPTGAGRIPIDQTGVWIVDYDIASNAGRRHFWSLTVFGSATGNDPIPGRVWTERYPQYQGGASNQQYWLATREGYRYQLNLNGYYGLGSSLQSNGFGMVRAGTCTPTYQSAEGSASGANGAVLDPSVEYSGPECGDAYKIFFQEPADDLPATASSARGTEWIMPAVVPASVDHLTFEQSDPTTRAGDIRFDLAGVNGGYTIQIDTNSDGDYTDAADRTITWGSPPGEVTVPFDGLDGVGNPIGVCQKINAKVVVDRAGEVHFTTDDVEQLSGGFQVTGATPGITAPDPLLYWDDRNLSTAGKTPPTPSVDGRSGVDTTTTGAHAWPSLASWGDMRMIENWSYYQADAGDEVAIEPPCDPAMTLTKDAQLDDTNDNGFADVGEQITYTFTAANTGNTALTDVHVTDAKVDGITPATQSIPAKGSRTFTASYTVTQADVNAGVVHNSATATGTPPSGPEITTPPAEKDTPTPPRDPQLTLDKSSALDDTNDNGRADVGETITYSFDVENTGNVTLTDVTVDDSKVSDISPAPVSLAPHATQRFTSAPYTVTQDDVNTGEVYNAATATGTSPTGPVESVPDEERVPTPDPDPGLTLDKSAELTGDDNDNDRADVGDTITYTFSVKNIGTIDLDDVVVDDSRVDAVSPASAHIDAGETATYTASYTVTQDDVDAGEVRNTATASGIYTSPGGVVEVDSAPDTAVVPAPDQAPDLEIIKRGELADANDNGFADVGETITYSFDVENTGNVTLEDVEVLDPRVTGLSPETVTLEVGESRTFTAEPYTVTQQDVDAGEVLNSATARGHVPGGPETTTPPVEHSEKTSPHRPGLAIDKEANLQDGNANGVADAGEQIVYTFDVTNTGNVTLHDVAVHDDRISGLVPDSIEALAPDDTFRFTAEPYTVTKADVAKGEIVNVATAVGTPPDSEDPFESGSDTATVRTHTDGGGATPEDPDGNGLLPDTGSPLGLALLLVAGLAVVGGVTLTKRRNAGAHRAS
jgi:uncharacterized repeat protein (TIGR01451 family)